MPNVEVSKGIAKSLLSQEKCSIFDVDKIIERDNLMLEKTVNSCNNFKKNYHKDILRMINIASDNKDYKKWKAKSYNQATEQMINNWDKDKDSAQFFNKLNWLTGLSKMDKKEGGLVTEMKDKEGQIKNGAE